LTMAVFFSVATFYHQYYLTEMAPAIAALFGIGIVTMWQDYRRSSWHGWLLPLALFATALEQIHILNSYPAWGQWLIPAIAILCTVGALTLVVLRLSWRFDFPFDRLRYMLPALGIGVLALMIAPAAWAGIPVLQDVSVQLPVAGPTQQGGFGGIAGGNIGVTSSANTDTALITYLEANQGSATYLVATASSQTADQLILESNKPIMALGGFSGSDPILTTSSLAALVKNGTVRFFLLNSIGGGFQPPTQFSENPPEGFFDRPDRRFGDGGFGGGGFGGRGQSSLTSWVTQNCASVPSSKWQSATSTGGFGRGQLYDCAGK
ncbi:MAG TPA: glycosyltransferase family 39 protein, partial [Ktedonobacteraceae bacterium]|nr:glycosyltransferase family 39 protein [Ktedonobacteraceae bacterium]